LECFGSEARSEVCDGCLQPIWLPVEAVNLVRAADRDGELIEVLCVRCAWVRYGHQLARGKMSRRET
jgi:hypothetical protein